LEKLIKLFSRSPTGIEKDLMAEQARKTRDIEMLSIPATIKEFQQSPYYAT